ncbi:MAG TPA: hypothetical protein VLL75_10050, partial [Vicinamibacteria bacterium]|nr:hypothetical protein [Vicinamibacteria bacterium]
MDYRDLRGALGSWAIRHEHGSHHRGRARDRPHLERDQEDVPGPWREGFGRRKLKFWDARFDEKPLIEELGTVFGERKLGDSSVLTGLCILAKRADTASTWPLINHPRGK